MRQRLTRVDDNPPDEPCEACGTPTEGNGRYTSDDLYLCPSCFRCVPTETVMRLVGLTKKPERSQR